MPVFPKKEAEIVALAQTMLAGLTAHPADFPSITAAELQSILSIFTASRDIQENARAAAQLATVNKEETLTDLVSFMKNNLKLAEVDTAANPTKLTEIGWGPKAQPKDKAAPASPSNLMSYYEGPGSLTLEWVKPIHDANRPVANYIIQRRQQVSTGGEFSDWLLIDMGYATELLLSNQPRGVQLEYRVIASNAAGESMPSNVAPVVL